jgi:hypothetical protein
MKVEYNFRIQKPRKSQDDNIKMELKGSGCGFVCGLR